MVPRNVYGKCPVLGFYQKDIEWRDNILRQAWKKYIDYNKFKLNGVPEVFTKNIQFN